ncbi:hypothetical protein VHEMI00635 [[Torrubiella] hemipterigena]|uniref:Uncharacterized protein n=1 Tax=[Torrubiella] hemipterigena TaxID=1531966 RepID=A0A0A1T533_9HYPO|nr:hypothetical protein VHEMI00635 [[Torrubiella] hemipterigena]
MNTVRSFWIGWGSVCVAGAGAYYFAKQEINADRKNKLEALRLKRQANRELEYGSPEGEENAQPQAPRRTPSKYEGAETYRSQKGDRFS